MRALCVDQRFAPTRNLVPHPKLRTNATGWGPVRGTPTQPDGTFTRLTCTVAATGGSVRLDQSQFAAVSDGQIVTGSAWTRTGSKTTRLAVQFFDAEDVFLTSFNSTESTTDNTWQRLSVTAQAPTGSASMRVILMQWSAAEIGDITDWRDVMLTPGPDLYAYADGDTPGWAWSGTPGASPSVGYPRPA